MPSQKRHRKRKGNVDSAVGQPPQNPNQGGSQAGAHENGNQATVEPVEPPVPQQRTVPLPGDGMPIAVMVEDPAPMPLDVAEVAQDAAEEDLSEALLDLAAEVAPPLTEARPLEDDTPKVRYCKIVDGEGKCPDHPEAITLSVGGEICCLECGRYWFLPSA